MVKWKVQTRCLKKLALWRHVTPCHWSSHLPRIVHHHIKLGPFSPSSHSAQVQVVSKPKVADPSVLWDFEECSPYTVWNVCIWTHRFVWKLPAAFLCDQHLFWWSESGSKPNTRINSTCTMVSDPAFVASPSIRFVNQIHMGSIMEGYRRPQYGSSRSNFL